jgi:valyl-tRNA synthetase
VSFERSPIDGLLYVLLHNRATVTWQIFDYPSKSCYNRAKVLLNRWFCSIYYAGFYVDARYVYQTEEEKIRSLWRELDVYDKQHYSGRPLFTIDTPPPTVSGTLHIGHIFSYTQTDIIARYKRMSGFMVYYPFGFDDNGLPTERYVEKMCNVRASTMSRSDFIQLCLRETERVEEQFKTLWITMGLSADFSKTYATISPRVRAIAQKSFIMLYEKNQVYRAHDPALYCTVCQTTVAQAELDDVQMPSLFNTIAFTHNQGNELLVGTTRPELLPSCVALLFHPTDTRYTSLQGGSAKVPLFDIHVPIIADDLVDPQKGTGLVMVCTFGDSTDIFWYKKHTLAYRQSFGTNGRFLPHTGACADLNVKQARAAILKELDAAGLLREQQNITHTVNVHERCQHPIEFMMIAQWFIKILPYKEQLLAIADTINWHPSFMKTRYIHWVENLKWDWAISRQRFFGIPFPVWHCQDCQAIICAEKNALPIDPQEAVAPQQCSTCGQSNITPDKDVMDTWNTSSLSPYICASLYQENDLLEQKEPPFLPMNMRPQAHDIIRTWAFYTMIKTWMHHDTIPWKDIVISGHVLSNTQQKLSKSKDNSKSNTPEHLMAHHSIDSIRYWTASASLGYDTPFSDDQLKIGHRLVTKLWNAFRFLEPHIAELSFTHHLDNVGIVNEWILHQATLVFEKYKAKFEQYEISLALEPVNTFFWQDFCDNYIELIKNQLFNPELYDPAEVCKTRQTLYLIGLRILQLYAPYLPHVTELLYQLVYKKQVQKSSLHHTVYDSHFGIYQHEKSVAIMEQVLAVIGQVRKLKTAHQLSLKSPLVTLTIVVQNQAQKDLLLQAEQLIRGVTQADQVLFAMNCPTTTQSLLEQTDGCNYIRIVL